MDVSKLVALNSFKQVPLFSPLFRKTNKKKKLENIRGASVTGDAQRFQSNERPHLH